MDGGALNRARRRFAGGGGGGAARAAGGASTTERRRASRSGRDLARAGGFTGELQPLSRRARSAGALSGGGNPASGGGELRLL